MVDKKWFDCYRECREYFFGTIDARPYRAENSKTSEMDRLLLPFLKSLLGDGKYSEFDSEAFVEHLSEVHTDKIILEIVTARWQAVHCVYLGNPDKALEILTGLYADCENSTDVPNWMKNDILIDVRNLTPFMGDETDAFWDVQNKLTNNNEDVYFPLLDRFNHMACSDALEFTIKELIADQNTSSDAEALNNYFNSFLVASFFGSISHIRLLNSKYKKLLFILCVKYANVKYFTRYLQASILNWDNNFDKKALTSTLLERFSLLTNARAKLLWDNIENMPLSADRLARKLIALRCIGDYLDEDTFIDVSNECLSLISNHLKNGNRTFRSGNSWYAGHTFITDFLERTIHRINVNDAVRIFFEELKIPKDTLVVSYLSRAFSNANFLCLDEKHFTMIADFIFGAKDFWDGNLDHFATVVRLSLDEKYFDRFDEAVKIAAPDFFEELYSFDVRRDAEAADKSIETCLANIAKMNKDKIGSGKVSSKDSTDLQTLYNIVSTYSGGLESEKLNCMLETVKEVIFAKPHSLRTKKAAIQLILLLLIKHKSDEVECIAKIIHMNREKIECVTFRSDSSVSQDLLEFQIDFLGAVLDNFEDVNFAFALARTKKFEPSERVTLASFIYEFSRMIDFWQTTKKESLTPLIQHIISELYSESNVVRHFSIRAITNFAKYNSEISDYVIACLQEIYDYETVANKTHILDGLRKIDMSGHLADNLLEQAKLDNNYHVSKLAFKLSKNSDAGMPI